MSSHFLNRAPGLVLLALFLSLLLAVRALAAATTADPDFVEPGHLGHAALSSVTPYVPASEFEELGHLGSSAYGLATRDQVAAIGEGSRLTILDISVPGMPVVLGKSAPTDGTVFDVALSGNLAFLASAGHLEGEQGSLRVMDIANPARPVEIGVAPTPSAATALALASDFAYVVTAAHDLRVFDISDPAQPVEMAALAIDGTTRDIVLAGSLAYIAAGDGGLQIVDIADPLRPRRLGAYTETEWATGIAVAGQYAYLAATRAGLRVFDVSDPTHPVPVWSSVAPRQTDTVLIHDHWLYATGKMVGELWVYDIADPAEPQEVGFLEDVTAWSLALSGETLYATRGNGGVQAIDVGEPAAPHHLGGYDLLASPEALVVDGKLAYVSQSDGALLVMDVSDPARPRLLGETTSDYYASELVLGGDLLFAVTGIPFVELFDVSDPANPAHLTTYTMSDEITDLVVVDDVLYAAAYYEGLQIFDLSDPLVPRLLSVYERPGGLWTMAVDNDFAYLVTVSGELEIVDVSDPEEPAHAGQFSTGGTIVSALADGSRLYVGDDDRGLILVDVSDPANPLVLGTTDRPEHSRLRARDGIYVYTVSYGAYPRRATLHLVNVANPGQPLEAARLVVGGSNALYGLNVTAMQIAFLTDVDGLRFLRYTGPRTVTGRITLSGGTPLSGVTVWAGPAHTTTDDGRYMLFDVPPGDHVVRPTLAGYTFDPPQTAVSLPPDRLDIDFTAMPWLESWSSRLPAVARP